MWRAAPCCPARTSRPMAVSWPSVMSMPGRQSGRHSVRCAPRCAPVCLASLLSVCPSNTFNLVLHVLHPAPAHALPPQGFRQDGGYGCGRLAVPPPAFDAVLEVRLPQHRDITDRSGRFKGLLDDDSLRGLRHIYLLQPLPELRPPYSPVSHRTHSRCSALAARVAVSAAAGHTAASACRPAEPPACCLVPAGAGMRVCWRTRRR